MYIKIQSVDKIVCAELCVHCSLYGDTTQAEDTLFFLTWRNSLSGPRPPHYRGFLITLR